MYLVFASCYTGTKGIWPISRHVTEGVTSTLIPACICPRLTANCLDGFEDFVVFLRSQVLPFSMHLNRFQKTTKLPSCYGGRKINGWITSRSWKLL